MDLMDYRRKIIANSPHLMSASEAIVSFSDGADLPLKSLNVGIEPVQSGTGDPSPSNIRPISGWSAVKVTRPGKNLIPYPYRSVDGTYQNVTRVTNADGSVTFNGTASANSYFNFVTEADKFAFKAGTYILSANTVPNNCLISVNVRVNNVNKYNVNLTAGNTSVIFTPQEDGLLRCYVTVKSGATVNDWTVYPMLRVVTDTDGTYEPYNGVTVTVQLGQTVYGATLNPLTGVLTVDRAMVVFDGSESGWFLQEGKRCGISNALPNVKLVDGTTRVIGASSNAFTEQTPNKSYDGVVGFSIESTGRLVVRQFSTNTMTLENWKSWLASNPLQVVYPLATPFEVQLTPQQVRSLYGQNTIFADTGNVALEYWAHP